MIGLAERLGIEEEILRKALENFSFDLRVASPGIIQSFDSVKQTVKVLIALREQIVYNDLDPQWVEIPILVDVPIVLPRAGGFTLTMPIQAGDECLVIFGDSCIDAWWAMGGIQNQMDKRRHDLSDGFAILTPWSQPKVLPNYSIDTTQLRTDDGLAYVEVTKDFKVNIVAPGDVNITTKNVNVIAAGNAEVAVVGNAQVTAAAVNVIAPGGAAIAGNVLVTGKLQATLGLTSGLGGIDQVEFQTHKHNQSGGGITSEPVAGS